MDQGRSKFSESFSLDQHWSIECSSLQSFWGWEGPTLLFFSGKGRGEGIIGPCGVGGGGERGEQHLRLALLFQRRCRDPRRPAHNMPIHMDLVPFLRQTYKKSMWIGVLWAGLRVAMWITHVRGKFRHGLLEKSLMHPSRDRGVYFGRVTKCLQKCFE